ncbi:Rv2175c family DNA-binding protein [Corynebacterium alimapuense]|uniref:DNA-binding protein n=1 Tax=Corynebacterium alimapuense TaxID=1576874 RepID=A0A3M8K8J8_9CORY|nr:Rv2175c family DNA-binding protein [Corynebacterium alimapuense]RNE49500.1 DNA-binding protein [Corynebacterium alimapuense]
MNSKDNLSTGSLEKLLADETLLSLPEAAELMGVPITRVYDLLTDRKLIAYVSDSGRCIPASLFGGNTTTGKFVPGVITLLTDGGYSDVEILEYLFTEDDSLPGRPVEALHGQLAREVVRRAQAMAI